MVNTVIIHAGERERKRIGSLLSAQGNIKVAAYGKDSYDALKLVDNLKPDVAIIDNQPESIEVEDILPLLRIRAPFTAIILSTVKINEYQLYRAASNKVSGFICLETDFDNLPKIIKDVSGGGYFISPFFAAGILRLFSEKNAGNPSAENHAKMPSIGEREKQSAEAGSPPGKDPAAILTKEELRILAKIGEGRTNAKIAADLGLAVGTVRNYASSILRKIGLETRSQMVRYACKYGFVSDNPESFGLSAGSG